MKYNIIGDIHSREIWKKLVREDCINAFVGDYFSPYYPYPFDYQTQVFIDILEFKNKHPETILLIGNHDEDHWHIQERYSRFNCEHVNEICQLFEDDKDKFQIAASLENKVLVTHAGVSKKWVNRYFKDIKIEPNNLAESINNLWLSGNYTAFNFENNCNSNDYCGESPQQGPLWIRPYNLQNNNVFKNTPYIQVVGHTQVEKINVENNIIGVDTLGFSKSSLIIEINNGVILFGINSINE